jgi:CheY-like chemotaxis protein
VSAITLDIQLPIIDGWRVLDRLKTDLTTRHIPVYVITTEEDAERGLALGALGFLNKPIKTREALDEALVAIRRYLERSTRELLAVASPGSETSRALRLAAGDGSVRVVALTSGLEALGALDQKSFDCVVVEPRPGDVESLETTAEILRQCAARRIPALLYSPASPAAEEAVARVPHGATVKTVRSVDRLVDQIALFLHSPVARLAPESRSALETLYSTDAVLAGKKVLLVDDDIRNIFAMTSVLERQNMEVFAAETGREAIEKLEATDGIDIVLMDIMMPDMDGYDTMREIRRKDRFRALPIIAVTAKAMKGDREKTLQAGAWDYLAKPVDTDQMLSVLRAWLHR